MELKPGYKQTEVGVIPEDWKVIDISDLCGLQRGFDITEATRVAGTVPVYSSSGLSYFHDKAMVSPPGVVTGRKGILGKVFFIEEPFWPHDTTLWVKDFKGNHPAYVALVLEHFHLERLDAATSVPTLNRNNLVGHPIPHPPKAQQQTIAEALSDADALIESLDQLIAKKRHLKQGAMQELLTGKRRPDGFANANAGYQKTEVGTIPQDWEVVSAGDACVKIQDGTHFSPNPGGNHYLYITSRNIRPGYLDLSGASRIDAAQHRSIYKRCDVKKGDLLLTKDGANTGNAALNPLDEEFSLLSSVAFLRFDQNRHSAAYFLQQILAPAGQRRLQDAMAGNAITRLTLEKIKKLRFAVPPTKAEQETIAESLSDMDAEIAALESKLAKARLIKQGMMHNLLTGRIRLV